MTDIWKPNIIVVGPGGAKGFLELGCIKKLLESNLLDNITHWTGISVGAAISLLITIGYEIDDIIELCMNVNIIEDILSINLDEAKTKLGLIRNKTVEDKLKLNVKKKFGFIPTLKQLYFLTGIVYTAVTFNIDKMRSEYLDKDSEPDLCCVEATLMSMAVPGLIQPRKYKGHVYVDGAIGSPYPVLYHDNGENDVLGIYISSEEDNYSCYKNPTSFAYRLIQSGMKRLRDQEIKYSSEKVKHIGLKTDIKDTTGLSLTKESRVKMIKSGIKCAEEFLKINANPEKYFVDLREDEEIPTLNESLGQLTSSVTNFIDLLTNNFKEKDEFEDLFAKDYLTNEEIEIFEKSEDMIFIPIDNNIKDRLDESNFLNQDNST